MNKDILGASVIVGGALLVASALIVREYESSASRFQETLRTERPAAPDPEPVVRSAPSMPTRIVAPPQTQPTSIVAQPANTPPAPKLPVQPQPKRAAPAPVALAITEADAREALGWVGADPEAEQIWVAAINDTKLTPNERKNLIEDLNETGFDDPRNLTANDLPIIEARIALVEQLAPTAIDDTNAAAFQEAYKDLVNMRSRLVQQ